VILDVEYDLRRAEALHRLAEGDPERAFDHFRWALWYRPGEPVEPARLSDALGVLARIVVAMGHRELAEACARASAGGGADALYEVGYELIETGLPAIAATVLVRCLELAPGTEAVVTELVAALERLLLYGEAKRLLAAHPALIESSFLCRYLYAYDAAMSGELALTRELAPGLQPADETQAFMAARITALLARADRMRGVTSLDDRDLRGWHHVVTGGVLLHRSAHGFDAGMNGRFAWLQDSASRLRTGVDRLAAVLAAWGETPPCVYAPPGRDHEVLGEVVAALLGVPRVPWPVVGVPAPGLVVAYDLAQVERRELERLVERRPGQIFYAHAAGWTEDGPVAPDILMLLHQSLVAPWPDDDGRAVEILAAEVLTAAPLEPDEIAHDDLAGLDTLVATAGAPVPARRERLWAGSPVPSNRFQ
jgi:hypothetical protein